MSQSEGKDKQTLHRGILRDLGVVAGLIFMRPSWAWASVGLVFFVLGALMHLWSKSCLVRNVVVTTTGPYRFARHPFYFANLLIDIGICLLSGNPWVLAIYLVAFFFVYLRTIRQEEQRLTEIHGQAYLDYAQRVPMLIPYKFWNIPGPLEASWVNIWRESEIPRLMRICAVPFYFGAVAAFRCRGELGDNWLLLFIGAICGALLMNFGSSYLRKRLRRMVPTTY